LARALGWCPGEGTGSKPRNSGRGGPGKSTGSGKIEGKDPNPQGDGNWER